MDDYYMGSLNDLIVVGPGRMLVSKYIPSPDPKNGQFFILYLDVQKQAQLNGLAHYFTRSPSRRKQMLWIVILMAPKE